MLHFTVSRKITFQSVMSGFIIWMDDFWSKDVTFFEFDIDWLKQTRNPALTWLGKLIFLGFYWTAGFIMDRKKLLNLQGLRFCEIKECVLDWKSWQDFVDWWADYNVIFGLAVSCGSRYLGWCAENIGIILVDIRWTWTLVRLVKPRGLTGHAQIPVTRLLCHEIFSTVYLAHAISSFWELYWGYFLTPEALGLISLKGHFKDLFVCWCLIQMKSPDFGCASFGHPVERQS